MRCLITLLGLPLTTWATSAAAQVADVLDYPPLDQPLYLECMTQKVDERLPFEDWPKLALYFPNGIREGFPEMRIVDRHGQLEGGRFAFSIKGEGHWSLIDSNGVPRVEHSRELPQIMFLPPKGPANFTMLFLKDGKPLREGVCLGMIGPNTAAAFEDATGNPSSLD